MAEWAIRMVTPIPIGKYKGCLAWVRLWETNKEAVGQEPSSNTQSIFPSKNSQQISRETHENSDGLKSVEGEKAEENEDESAIVVFDDDILSSQPRARPNALLPPLEPEPVEETPHIIASRGDRRQAFRSARRLKFEDQKENKSTRFVKPKAPKDIEGNIDSSNIVSGRRARKPTPATASTHTYRLAIAEDEETQFATGLGNEDGLRYEDVCPFMRVLRKPKKQLRLIPQVVEARRKEVQGLYDAKCLQWATWDDAMKDNIKPIRTGFVDAIKMDEATGENKYKSRLVIYGNQMISFQHFSPYETSSPVAQHIFLLTLCSLLVALNALIKRVDFSQAYSHANMQEVCYAVPPDECKLQDKPNMVWRVLKALYGSPQAGGRWAATIRFHPRWHTTKGNFRLRDFASHTKARWKYSVASNLKG
eukprot:g41230.t1